MQSRNRTKIYTRPIALQIALARLTKKDDSTIKIGSGRKQLDLGGTTVLQIGKKTRGTGN